MSATIKDVAREAGLSVATVSRVLNGSCSVSEDASNKVNEAVKKLHYSPNFLGRNLRKCETNVILCIMPASEHSFYSKIVKGMQTYASEVGYDIITATTDGMARGEERQMKMLFNRTVDGVVLLGSKNDKDTLNELAENYNIALCCEGIEGADVLTVVVDDEKAGYDATKALIDMGHKKIAFIGSTYTCMSAVKRERGYRKAMADAGLEIPEKYIFKKDYEYPCGSEAFEQFWSLDDKPTAIFAISDLLAISVIKKAYEKGVKIGSELSVIGFDNISMSEMMIPSVSTVEQPCQEMGETVMAKLIDNIHGKQKDNSLHIVKHKVILRESSCQLK